MAFKSEDIFVSFDVVSLFTMVLVNDILELLRQYFANDMFNLLLQCLKTTYSQFKGQFY